MSRAESVIVAAVVFIACPATCFTIAWWVSASLGIPERAVAACALAGLAVGTALAAAGWKRCVSGFYTHKRIVLVALYLFWSAMALAFLMGLPIGNVLLGVLAGLYVGRRARHAGTPAAAFQADARRISLFAASITGLVSLAMGILAVHDQHSMQAILGFVGLGRLAAAPAGRAALVAVAVPVLIAVQYWLTHKASRWTFRLGAEPA